MDRGLPSTSGVRWFFVWLLLLIFGVTAALVVFWPSPVDASIRHEIARVIEELHERGVPAFVNYEFIEFSANVVMFLPIGVVLGLALPVRWCVFAFVLGPAISAGVEYAQLNLLEARYASPYDVIANSIGATIGVVVALLLRGLVSLRDDKVIARYEAERRLSHSG